MSTLTKFAYALYGGAMDAGNQLIYVSSATKHTVWRIALSGTGIVKGCAAPTNIPNALSPSCREGAVVPVSKCTPSCATGWLATEDFLSCRGGVLLPTMFECVPGPCWAPAGLPNSHWPVACKEGRQMDTGQNCTAMCAPPYLPSHNITCFAGKYTTDLFVCTTTTTTTTTSTTTKDNTIVVAAPTPAPAPVPVPNPGGAVNVQEDV